MKYESERAFASLMLCGPAQSGKTTLLNLAKAMSAQGTASAIVHEDRHSERVAILDISWPDLPKVHGRPMTLRIMVLPGSTYYAANRRAHIGEIDALLFVADSRRGALDENIAALNDLFADMHAAGRTSNLPAGMIFSKQDASDAFGPSQLIPLLNARSWPSWQSRQGDGSGIHQAILELTKQIAANAPPSETPSQISAAKTWLLTCWRCRSMLEVTGAAVGKVFSCGACRSALQVVDLEHGTTQVPATRTSGTGRYGKDPTGTHRVQNASGSTNNAGANSGTARYQSSQELVKPTGNDVSGASEALSPRDSALVPRQSGSGLPLAPNSVNGLPPGFEVQAMLDSSPLGRRLRVLETASKKVYRALIIPPQVTAIPGFVSQLENIARLGGPLRDPRINALQSMIPVDGGMVFLSESPADREPLTHVLSRRRVLAPPHAIGVALQIVEALDVASRSGVVHGWLRPDVVWLAADGAVQIDELWVAKPFAFLRGELNGPTAATEYYVAPEILHDDMLPDVRTDLFGVGALIFRMISGQGLVTGYTANEALHRFVAQGPVPLRNVVPNLSRDLEQAVKRFCAVDRRERIGSLSEAHEILRRFGGGAQRQTLRLTQPVNNPAKTGPSPTKTGPSTISGPSPVPAQSPARRTTQGVAPVRHPTPAPHHPEAGANLPPGGPVIRHASSTLPRPGRSARPSGSKGLVIVFFVTVILIASIAALLYIEEIKVIAGVSKKPGVDAPNSATASAQPLSRPADPGMAKPEPVKPDPVKPEPVKTEPVKTGQNPDAGLLSSSAPVAPVVPPTSGEIPTSQPEPANSATTSELTPAQIKALRGRIDDAILRQEFTQAEQLIPSLPNSEHERYRKEISGKIARLMAALPGEVAVITDPALRRAALVGPLEKWGIPSHVTWAEGLLAQAPGTATPVPSSTESVTSGATTPAGAPSTATGSSWTMWRQHMTAKAYDLAKAEAGRFPEDDATVLLQAMLWNERISAVLRNGLEAQTPLLRLTNPMVNEVWDLRGVHPTGVEVVSPGDSTALLLWSQLAPSELVDVIVKCAIGSREPADHAVAITALVIAGRSDDARVHLAKYKAVMPADSLKPLARLVALAQ